MKKCLAILLTAVMVLTLAAGCCSAEAGKTFKIGFLFSNFDTMFGRMVRAQVEEAGKELGIEFVFTADEEIADDQINSLENVLSAGVDGVLIAPVSTSMVPKIVQMCAGAETPVMCCFRDLTYDEEAYNQVKDNPYFLGATFEGETQAGYDMCKYLNEIGHTRAGIIWFPPGQPLSDTRMAGWQKAIDEGLIENTSSWTFDGTDALNSFLGGIEYFCTTGKNDVDAIVQLTGNLPGPASINVVESYSLQDQIKIVTYDQFDGMDAALESGVLVFSACGHHVDPLYALMVLYNYLNGTPVTEGKFTNAANYLYVTNIDQFKKFEPYCNIEKVIYTAEDIRKMVGIDEAGLKEIMAAYNIDILK